MATIAVDRPITTAGVVPRVVTAAHHDEAAVVPVEVAVVPVEVAVVRVEAAAVRVEAAAVRVEAAAEGAEVVAAAESAGDDRQHRT